MSMDKKLWALEDRKEEIKMILKGATAEEIAEKFERKVSAVKHDQDCVISFIKGEPFKDAAYKPFYKACKLVLLEILEKNILNL